MSEENVEVARYPLTVRATSSRRLDERLALRFPRATVRLGHVVLRLPARSRLRRALIVHGFQRAIEARNRYDSEVWLVAHHPKCQVSFTEEFRSLGIEPDHSSREARIRFEKAWRDEWGDLRLAPEAAITIGHQRAVIVGRAAGSGPSSGAAFDSDWGCLITFDAGQIVGEEHFLHREEALEAAGLTE
jgi:hypothetical protein